MILRKKPTVLDTGVCLCVCADSAIRGEEAKIKR